MLTLKDAMRARMRAAILRGRAHFITGRRGTDAAPLEGRSVETLDFTCNVCGTRAVCCPVEKIDREVASCDGCGSSVRMRSIVHLLSLALHGKSMPLPDWPVNKSIRGVGLSDWHGYATRLPRKVDYINTYFHTEPYLDICDPPENYTAAFDFLISTEVYEHVPPPAARAFENSFKILKPGGTFVFTVPFTNAPDTTEHFPDLNRYEIVKIDDDYVMVNRKKDGSYELHTKLAFHGGPGTTLEMRVYSRQAVLRHLQDAGFVDVTVMEDPYLEAGIIHKHLWSLPILARRPAA